MWRCVGRQETNKRSQEAKGPPMFGAGKIDGFPSSPFSPTSAGIELPASHVLVRQGLSSKGICRRLLYRRELVPQLLFVHVRRKTWRYHLFLLVKGSTGTFTDDFSSNCLRIVRMMSGSTSWRGRAAPIRAARGNPFGPLANPCSQTGTLLLPPHTCHSAPAIHCTTPKEA